MTTLLLGMGNLILGDDAIGVLLARDLGSLLEGKTRLEVVEEGPPGPLDLVERILGYGRVVVIDSILTRDGAPGAWYHLTAAALRGTTHLRNVHGTNFATALELSRQFGLAVPPDDRIHILAIEILQDDTFGENLSPPLGRAYPRLVEELLAEVRAIQTMRSTAAPRSRPSRSADSASFACSSW